MIMETIVTTNPALKNTEVVAKAETVLEVQHLKKSFGNNHVLQDVSFHLRKGENFAVLGRSGSGKSVLIKCIVGLIQADGGKLIVLKKNMEELKQDELKETRKKIGFLFQSGALYDSMTVRENLEFPLRNLKQKSRKA